MTNLLRSVVERKLQALAVPVQLSMPDGSRLGPANAKVYVQVRDRRALAHLAQGAVGVLGEDYVEGRIDIQGNTRDMTAAAAFATA